MPIVSVKGVNFSYAGVAVLRDVQLEIQEGEFVGLIGPNGGGKTTLLRLLMGFLQPQEGSVEIAGRDPKAARGVIGYVPQRLPFDRQFPISVREVVLTGLLSHLTWYGTYLSSDQKLADEALERVGLTHLQKQPFGALSGGQAQRVLVARAIASRPKLLFLDEPTSSVDVNAQSDIFALLQSLMGSMTILMVTHDLNAVVEQVQRIFCVQGQVFPLSRDNVCRHFAYGLYHTPLLASDSSSTTPFSP